MFDLFWDLNRPDSPNTKLLRNAEKSMELTTLTHQFEDRLEKLTMISMALWTLLKEVSDLTDQELLEKVKEIDLSDGKLDGKVRHGVTKCPSCERTMSNKHRRCLYCGHAMSNEEDVFDGITG